jgi:Domain of unknown function (DUF5666)
MFINNRVLIISGIVAVFLAGCIGLGLAFAFSHMNQASSQQITPTAIPTVIGSTTNNASGQRACIIGIVQSISSQSFVVSANQGKRVVTVTVNDQTAFSKHGNQASSSLAALGVGNRVRIIAQGQCNRKETTVMAQSVAILAVGAGLTPTSTATPTP